MSGALDLEFQFNSDSLLSDLPGALDTLNHFALSGGKRFRPALLLKVAKCLAVDPKIAAPFAIVAERIHNATLLHDDVVDESPSRRGKATLNARGENKKAVLGGDLLLARTLRDLGVANDAGILKDMFNVLVDLTEGEWLQLESRCSFDIGARHLREVARKKTGSLIGWCCATPARIKGEPLSTIETLREVGVLLGVAFQLIDDCLDFDRSSGKPFAQDLKEGQMNFVTQDLIENSSESRAEIKSHLLLESPSEFSPNLMAKILLSVKKTLSRAETEIALANTKIYQTAVHPSVKTAIEHEVIVPFLNQIKKTRETMRA
jgi:octaprenyl-diphosphate synthase